MIINKLMIDSFRSIDHIELTFPPTGLITITGPNESGKSSILNAIEFVLFGDIQNPEFTAKEPINVIQWGAQESKIVCNFTKGSNCYEIQRRIIATSETNNYKQTALLTKLHEPAMSSKQKPTREIVANSITHVNQHIETITGFDHHAFCKLIYIKQHDLLAIKELRRKDRRELINQLIGIEKIKLLEKGIRTRLKKAGQQKDYIKSDITTTKDDLISLREYKQKRVKLFDIKQELEEKSLYLADKSSDLSANIQDFLNDYRKIKTKLKLGRELKKLIANIKQIEIDIGHLEDKRTEINQALEVTTQKHHHKQINKEILELQTLLEDIEAEIEAKSSVIEQISKANDKLQILMKRRQDSFKTEASLMRDRLNERNKYQQNKITSLNKLKTAQQQNQTKIDQFKVQSDTTRTTKYIRYWWLIPLAISFLLLLVLFFIGDALLKVIGLSTFITVNTVTLYWQRKPQKDQKNGLLSVFKENQTQYEQLEQLIQNKDNIRIMIEKMNQSIDESQDYLVDHISELYTNLEKMQFELHGIKALKRALTHKNRIKNQVNELRVEKDKIKRKLETLNRQLKFKKKTTSIQSEFFETDSKPLDTDALLLKLEDTIQEKNKLRERYQNKLEQLNRQSIFNDIDLESISDSCRKLHMKLMKLLKRDESQIIKNGISLYSQTRIDQVLKAYTLHQEQTTHNKIRIDAQLDLLRRDIEDFDEAQLDKLEQLNKSLNKVNRDIRVLKEVRYNYRQTAKTIRNQTVPLVAHKMERLLPNFTANQHQKVKLDERLTTSIFSPDKNDYIPTKYLSGGTNDQIILALRIAFSEALLEIKNLNSGSAIFLDECFASSDRERKQKILDMLHETTRHQVSLFQQIFLISHDNLVGDYKIHLTRGKLAQ